MHRLGDFRRYPGHVVRASCLRCNCYVTLAINALAQHFGLSMPVDEIKSLLRCTRCGETGKLSLGYSIDPAPLAQHLSSG